MNDNENILLRDSGPSIASSPGAVGDGQMYTPSTIVDNPPEEHAIDRPENFESLTFVSSRGFFFH